MTASSGNVRAFLLDSFSDEEVEGLCFMYFPEAQNTFSAGMSKEAKARQLIAYCQHRGLIAELFKALQAERPVVFAQVFPGPLPTRLEDLLPDVEPAFVSVKEIQVSEVIADRLIAERAESIRIFQIILVVLVTLGVLVISGAVLFMIEPYRPVTAASGFFIAFGLGVWQARGIIGRRAQKSRCETIKVVLGMVKQGEGSIDAETWKQIQAYLWGEMKNTAPEGRVLV